MFHSLTKPTIVLGATFVAVLSLGFAVPANAAPPPGMRWSDTVGLTAPRSQTTRTRPSDAAPQFFRYAPVVVSPDAVTASPAPATIAIRGPDGVVRTYSIESGVVQQTVPTFAYVLGTDGVLRSYPVVSGSGVVTYPSSPCR